jgi:hypothetical protein
MTPLILACVLMGGEPPRETIDAYARQSVRIIKRESDTTGFGSGTIVTTDYRGHGYVLTCRHIFKDNPGGVFVQRIGDSKTYPARLVKISDHAELAALETGPLPSANCPGLTASQPQRIVVYATDGDSAQFHRHAGDYVGSGVISNGERLDAALYSMKLHSGDSGAGVWDADGNLAGVASHVARDGTQSAVATTRDTREFLETCDWFRGSGFSLAGGFQAGLTAGPAGFRSVQYGYGGYPYGYGNGYISTVPRDDGYGQQFLSSPQFGGYGGQYGGYGYGGQYIVRRPVVQRPIITPQVIDPLVIDPIIVDPRGGFGGYPATPYGIGYGGGYGGFPTPYGAGFGGGYGGFGNGYSYGSPYGFIGSSYGGLQGGCVGGTCGFPR